MSKLHPDRQIHPRHPGLGSSTSLIAAESIDGDAEVGGLVIFFPSGHHIAVAWRSAAPINPTVEAAKKYAAEIIEKLVAANSSDAQSDIDRTNWVSVTAAIQRILLDFNDGIKGRIAAEMVRRFGDPTKVH